MHSVVRFVLILALFPGLLACSETNLEGQSISKQGHSTLILDAGDHYDVLNGGKLLRFQKKKATEIERKTERYKLYKQHLEHYEKPGYPIKARYELKLKSNIVQRQYDRKKNWISMKSIAEVPGAGLVTVTSVLYFQGHLLRIAQISTRNDVNNAKEMSDFSLLIHKILK